MPHATPTLETKRLILREVSLDDAPAIQKHFNNWNIIQNLSTIVPWPYPNNGALTFIRDSALPRIRQKGHLVWVITLKSNPAKAIGVIDLSFETSDRGNRGFWIAENFQKQGLMSEAVARVNDYVFIDLGIERLEVMNSVKNTASRRVKEKTGARFICYTELEHHNGISKTELWEITRQGWIEFRNQP